MTKMNPKVRKSTYTLKLELPGLPRMTNPSGRKNHWRDRHKESQKWKELVALSVGRNKPPHPLKKAKLKLIRYSSVSPDPDGLVSGFKHIIDGLVSCGVLYNDKMENIGMPHYDWQRTSPKKGKVSIEVEEVNVEKSNYV